ncbi:MAG: molybdate transport system substrate-binding protein [Pseudomonadales bacterium]|jgi:molybdate transport system substrate-binding protein
MQKNLLITVLLLCVNTASGNDQLHLGVASSFKPAAVKLISAFSQQTDSNIKLSSASSGKLFSQALNGAPFDIILFGDSKHSLLSEDMKLAVTASRFSYAIGEIALVSTSSHCLNPKIVEFSGTSLAIANPKIAPYGLAAKQVMRNQGLDQIENLRLINAENAAQTLHFFATGNVDHAITSSVLIQQWLARNTAKQIIYCPLSTDSYDAIIHQGVILQHSENQQLATALVNFILSNQGQTIISALGYQAVSE